MGADAAVDAVLSGAATHHVACERAEAFIDTLPDGCVSLMTLGSTLRQGIALAMVVVRVTSEAQRHEVAQIVVLGTAIVLLLVVALDHVARRRRSRGRLADALHAAGLASVSVAGVDSSPNLVPVRPSERDVFHAGSVHVGRIPATRHALGVGEVKALPGAVLVLLGWGALERNTAACARSVVLRLPVRVRSARALRGAAATVGAVALSFFARLLRGAAVRADDFVHPDRSAMRSRGSPNRGNGHMRLVPADHGDATAYQSARDVVVVSADGGANLPERPSFYSVEANDRGRLRFVDNQRRHDLIVAQKAGDPQ